MILWRPTNNNQRYPYKAAAFLLMCIVMNNNIYIFLFRYAFTPLLDAPDDDRDETELFIKETYNGDNILFYCTDYLKNLIAFFRC